VFTLYKGGYANSTGSFVPKSNIFSKSLLLLSASQSNTLDTYSECAAFLTLSHVTNAEVTRDKGPRGLR
jgi:hypothetical protein